MLIVDPDFARRIDLPGNAPCPRPVDIDRHTTRFANLVSLRVYSFASDAVIDGEAEDDEVFVVLMRGAADIAVDAAPPFALGTDGGARAVYLPPHAAYRLTARTACDIAYARVRPPEAALKPARDFAPVGDRLDVAGHAAGMDLALSTVSAGEALPLPGEGERFVHVRSDDGGVATIGGARVNDWKTIALAAGEAATLEITEGSLDVLTITASTR